MITMSPTLPQVSDVGSLLDLIRLVTDGDAVKSRIEQILTAQAAFMQIKADADAAVAESRKTLAEHSAQMVREADEHTKKMSADRAKFDFLCGTGMEEVRAARANANTLLAQACRCRRRCGAKGQV